MTARSLLGRLSLVQQLSGALLIVAFAGLAIGISSATLSRQERAFVSEAARQVAADLDRERREEGDLARAASELFVESTPPGVGIEVFDAAGRRVAARPISRAPIAAVETRSQSVELATGGRVVVSVSTRSRRAAVAALAEALLLTAIPLGLGVLIVSRVTTRATLAPLARLAAEADRLAGHTAPRTLTVADDPVEIVALSQALDRLLAQVHEMLRAERHFSQDAAHELRTPLTVLSGEIELVLSDPTLAERHRYGLTRAAEQVRAMSDLVEALLLLRRADLAASTRDEFAAVDLSELVDAAVVDLRRLEPARATDLVIQSSQPARVQGNATLLAAAIRNLLTNALKFSPAGQPIRIAVGAGAAEATVVVEDGGPGVAPADRARIFDPFYRSGEARAVRDGVGLGLPIIQRVARAHGGSVSLAESPARGARFELHLPTQPCRGSDPPTPFPSGDLS